MLIKLFSTYLYQSTVTATYKTRNEYKNKKLNFVIHQHFLLQAFKR
jgi:hypothetical protein